MEIEYDWNRDTDQWEENNKSEYTYDANGNQTIEIEYDWEHHQSVDRKV